MKYFKNKLLFYFLVKVYPFYIKKYNTACSSTVPSESCFSNSPMELYLSMLYVLIVVKPNESFKSYFTFFLKEKSDF